MKYFFAFVAAVALIVIVFILILNGFRGDRPRVQTELIDYAQTKTVMRMTVEGRVNLDADHRKARVTIGRDGNVLQLVSGYDGSVLNRKEYDSNEDAYATFLRALQLQGYTKGNDDPKAEDSRGVCPTGKVYTFEIITGSAVVQKFWTTSCGGGTFRGNTGLIRQLFRAQVPDYTKMLRGTGLN